MASQPGLEVNHFSEGLQPDLEVRNSAQGLQSAAHPYGYGNSEHLLKQEQHPKEAYDVAVERPEQPSRPARVYGLTPLAFGALVALATALIMGAILGGALGGSLASCKKDKW
jgi:hypothetical protein